MPQVVRIVLTEAVAGHRSATVAVGAAAAQVVHVADTTGPEIETVGVGRTHDRAVIAVADRKGISECVMVGNVLTRQVRHGDRALGNRP